MRKVAIILAVGWALAAAGPPLGRSAPKPRIVPIRWELDFEHQTPQPITVVLRGENRPRTYWYLLYTVTNSTKADQIFVPSFVLYTDTGQVLHAGDKISTGVFAAIQKRHNNPHLRNIAAITGRILQGEDNARDGVAIWRDFDGRARAFDVFAGGLSGEQVKIKLPSPVQATAKDDQGKTVAVTQSEAILSKTLQLQYTIPGEAPARARTGAKLLKKRWVMR